MAIKIEGLDGVLASIDKLGNVEKVAKAMGDCCALVERSAKQKAHAIRDTGGLANSIKSKVETEGNEVKGIIYTTAEHGPYVEYGTGLFAEKKGRTEVPWVFVKGGTSSGEKKKKTYTLEKAKQTVAILRSKGLEAYYTYGQKPQPYMRPSLNENRNKIIKVLKGSIRK